MRNLPRCPAQGRQAWRRPVATGLQKVTERGWVIQPLSVCQPDVRTLAKPSRSTPWVELRGLPHAAGCCADRRRTGTSTRSLRTMGRRCTARSVRPDTRPDNRRPSDRSDPARCRCRCLSRSIRPVCRHRRSCPHSWDRTGTEGSLAGTGPTLGRTQAFGGWSEPGRTRQRRLPLRCASASTDGKRPWQAYHPSSPPSSTVAHWLSTVEREEPAAIAVFFLWAGGPVRVALIGAYSNLDVQREAARIHAVAFGRHR